MRMIHKISVHQPHGQQVQFALRYGLIIKTGTVDTQQIALPFYGHPRSPFINHFTAFRNADIHDNFFFNQSFSTCSLPICSYRCDSLASLTPAPAALSLNALAECSSKTFFHCWICVGCTSYCLASSGKVFCSFIASIDTLALNSTLYFFLLNFFIFNKFTFFANLNLLSDFWGVESAVFLLLYCECL